MKRTRLAPMSAKRKRDHAIYMKKRAAFLEAHPFCQVWIQRMGLDEEAVIQWGGNYKDLAGEFGIVPRSEDVHHVAGRSGSNYLDESTWLAVSREQHESIHSHPSFARRQGWLK